METTPYNLKNETQIAVQQSFLPKVFSWMAAALAVSAAAALFTASSPAMLSLVFGSKVAFFGLIIAEFVLVLGLSAAINRLSTGVAILLYMLYAVINGVTLASIFFIYDISVIGSTFLVTTLMFGIMSVYGYKTREDLTRFGAIMSMALIGLILAMVVNLFLHSSMMEWIISLAGVLIFVGLIAWDTQKLRLMTANIYDSESANKMAILGALTLYLDFINLFLFLLRLFGGRRD